MQSVERSLHEALKQDFGFDSFRPLQEEIIRASLAGRDVFALMPTGGGKSLCFQLPAMLRDGLTIVVSPLIALMKDQVDALQAAGLPATFVNSSLDPAEVRSRMQKVLAGEYRLLYVAPERIMQPAFLQQLHQVDLALIAIDEAHCISEWGHDFRPEYRQLVGLRDLFRPTPFMALTATATERVREDIVQQLRLRDPGIFVGSFNRPNLTYRVVRKNRAYDQLLGMLREKPSDGGIVYCQARRTTESLAERLRQDGIPAVAYHAGLQAEERSENQDRFIRDDVRVVCATIAFGMGIDKPNVRFVYHYDLPKSVEGYYQETGRAGRDGLPSDCVLLYSNADVARFSWFIDEKEDPAEQERAREQLQEMTAYAESAECRRRQLQRYFGEEFDAENCGACDNCLDPKGTIDGTSVARKFLACLYRIKERSGFSVGVRHVADVLAGAKNEKITRFRHDELSAYGAGSEHTATRWAEIGRELLAAGLLEQRSVGLGKVLEITPDGREVMVGRREVTLREPEEEYRPSRSRAGSIECDEPLFERLRALRKRLADERDVPAYVIFSDVALRQMARDYPETEAQFMRVSGVGQKKLEEFGGIFMREVKAYLSENERKTFDSPQMALPQEPARVGESALESLRLLKQGSSVEQIAEERGLAESTVWGHLAQAVEGGEEVDTDGLIPPDARAEIDAAFQKTGANITGARELLGERYDYGLLRLYRATKVRVTA